MMFKGTQRRLAVSVVALTALLPVALLVRPASAFPHGDPVSKFNDKFVAATRIAKLKQTISPKAGTFKGSIDGKTGQLKGTLALPTATFADPAAGLMTATAAIVPTKPVTGHFNRSNSHVTATSTFVLHIVTASTSKGHAAHVASSRATQPPVTLPTLPGTLPTLPITLPTLPGGTLPTLPVTLPTTPAPLPVNLVGSSCATGPITMVLNGIANGGSLSNLTNLTGTFTIPDLTKCGPLTDLLNSLLAGPGNTFAGNAGPASGGSPAPPCLLPPLPVTLPSLPVTLPVTLPTLPCITLPGLP
jgi:hypothetical protein